MLRGHTARGTEYPLKRSSHGRASVHDGVGWRTVRPDAGPYASAPLVEWGSITKGLVATAAAKTLPLDEQVLALAPRFDRADFTVRDLVEHTSGLPRLHVGMSSNPLVDPYKRTVGRSLAPEAVVRATTPGKQEYSNLGYAVLGELLDDVEGSWFSSVERHALVPAGITTATTDPPEDARVVPRLLGRRVRPWTMAGSPYAASGGIWSTFEDLCRYAAWALDDGGDTARTIAWQRQERTTWINGEVRASGAAIVSAGGVTAVVHTLAQRPHAADRLATAIIERTLRQRT